VLLLLLLLLCRKVNTLQLHSDGVHLLSSASDGTVAVWDIRQLEQQHSSGSSGRPKICKPVAAAHHSKSSQGAYWEPGGGPRVLSVSFDDTLKIWELGAGALTQQVRQQLCDDAGRVNNMHCRSVWASSGDAGVLPLLCMAGLLHAHDA
jgi:WD40 repeat protein